MNLNVTVKQMDFISSTADEVLFGGSAGGGKSYAQLIDTFLFALKYSGSKQLLLRRTFPELKRSLILNSLIIFPKDMAKYNESDKKWKFVNGSMVEFGYCDSENDVTQYQSAEYDCIRFDELTHFTEFQYTYLISRIRGVNNFPKQIKCSTNPGSVGHAWVKKKFIDNKIPNQIYTDDLGRTTIFIPAKVQDNKFLMDADPQYIKRLEQLPESQRKALLEGEWDIFEGQYFNEFNKDIHVINPFVVPLHWKRYRTIDYGLDMLACYWIAVDTCNKAYVYKELYQPNLVISEATKRIKDMTTEEENIYCTYAPPDLWNRRQETGKSAAEIFGDNGIWLSKADNNRIQGWYNLKEWLRPYQDEQSITTANIVITNNCVNLIRCLPAVQYDKHDPNDVSSEPHELTHSVDALRYFIAGRPSPTRIIDNNQNKKLADKIGIGKKERKGVL